MKKTITLKQWKKSKKPFTDFANNGDIVADDIVEYFREILPPFKQENDHAEVLQCSEPCEIGRYITFLKIKKHIIKGDKTPLDVWMYSGILRQNPLNN